MKDRHPVVLIRKLIVIVESLDLHHGTENSLVKKLGGALKKLEDGKSVNDHAAVHKLKAFINAVEAQSGKKIDRDDATGLITDAQFIVDLMENTLASPISQIEVAKLPGLKKFSSS